LSVQSSGWSSGDDDVRGGHRSLTTAASRSPSIEPGMSISVKMTLMPVFRYRVATAWSALLAVKTV
jgi:hypothetical protein